MPKTSQILTLPLRGTTVAPVYSYTEEQEAQIKGLREVCIVSLAMTFTSLTALLVCGHFTATGRRFVLSVGAQLPEQAGHDASVHEGCQVVHFPAYTKVSRGLTLTFPPGSSRTRRNGSRRR